MYIHIYLKYINYSLYYLIETISMKELAKNKLENLVFTLEFTI